MLYELFCLTFALDTVTLFKNQALCLANIYFVGFVVIISRFTFLPAFRPGVQKESRSEHAFLTSHFAKLVKVIQENETGPDRILNLDKIYVTLEKDFGGLTAAKRLMPRRGRTAICDMKLADWAYTHSVTMMSAISASRECGRTLFVFKGTRCPIVR